MLAKYKLPPDISFMGTALLVGTATGIGAVAFRYLIRFIGWFGYEWFPKIIPDWGNAYVIIIPAIGGLIVGPLIYFYAREAKGHGVPEVMEAVALKGGRIRPIVAVVKSLASSITIGSGGSVGREGPIVQIGSAIGSSLGQKLRLSDGRIRNLVACGAAAGIAATFNAPIAGVIFALEVILGEFGVRYFSSVVISSVVASIIGQSVFGAAPAFHIPVQYGINSLWEFGLYPLLGVAAAFVGVGFVKILYWSEDIFESWKNVPEWVRPAIGGLLLGSLALAYPSLTGVQWDHVPQIYNVGYEIIENALANELALRVVISLLLLKLIATSLTLGSGGSGGVFAPSLFMGAMLGTAFEQVATIFFPEIVGPPGAYALVGMGAVFAGSAHAPITAVIILFELTGDYQIILPLMLAVVVSTMLAQHLLGGESIYTMKLSRRGIRLHQGRDVDVMEGLKIEEVMIDDVYAIGPDENLEMLTERLNQTRTHGLIVLDKKGKLWGFVSISNLETALENQQVLSTTFVRDIATQRTNLQVSYPDDSIGEALKKMSSNGFGKLPIVSRKDQNQLVGLIRKNDVIRAYNLALAKKAELQHQTKKSVVGNIDGTDFVEVKVKQNDFVEGKTIQEISKELPDEITIVSIRRNKKILIPHDSTVIERGDVITAFVRTTDINDVLEILSNGPSI